MNKALIRHLRVLIEPYKALKDVIRTLRVL
jgi:hypothetical protein